MKTARWSCSFAACSTLVSEAHKASTQQGFPPQGFKPNLDGLASPRWRSTHAKIDHSQLCFLTAAARLLKRRPVCLSANSTPKFWLRCAKSMSLEAEIWPIWRTGWVCRRKVFINFAKRRAGPYASAAGPDRRPRKPNRISRRGRPERLITVTPKIRLCLRMLGLSHSIQAS